jgi:hypothetical protein
MSDFIDVLQFAAVIASIAVVTVGSYAAVKATQRIWGDGPSPDELLALNKRLDLLHQAVDTMAVEIERISEGQRYLTKVLASRPADAASLPASAGAPPRQS